MIRVLGEPFEKLNIYTELKEWLASGDGFVNVTGTTGEGTDRVFMMQGFGADASERLILTAICSSTVGMDICILQWIFCSSVQMSTAMP